MKEQEAFIVTSEVLAELFGCSARTIQNLVADGIIEHCGTGRAFRFSLETVVPQYAHFLLSQISPRDWAPK